MFACLFDILLLLFCCAQDVGGVIAADLSVPPLDIATPTLTEEALGEINGLEVVLTWAFACMSSSLSFPLKLCSYPKPFSFGKV